MSSVPVFQNFINGQFTHSEAHLDVFNPATGALLSRVPASNAADVDQALAAARAAQKDWSAKPAIERAGHLRRIAAKLRENCLLYTSPSPRDLSTSRMPSSA